MKRRHSISSAKYFPPGFLLVDTYDSIASSKKDNQLGIHTNGIRLR